MYKDYVICHTDPYPIFGPMQAAFKIREWHTHPLTGTGDTIVTLDLMATGVRDDLAALEAAGKITRLPTLTSGNPLPAAIAKHPVFVAAGITPASRTYDAGQLLKAHIGWNPLDPDR